MEAKVELTADVTMEAVIVRCGCPDEATGTRLHGAASLPCPTPRIVESKGEVAREHFEGADALAKYREWTESTGLTIPHVEKKLRAAQGGKG